MSVRGILCALLAMQAIACACVVMAFAVAAQFAWASVLMVALGLTIAMYVIVRDNVTI